MKTRPNEASTSRGRQPSIYGPQWSWANLMRWDVWPLDAPAHWPDPALAGLQWYKPDHQRDTTRHGEPYEVHADTTYHLERGSLMSKQRWTRIVFPNMDPNHAAYVGTPQMQRSNDLSAIGHAHQQWCYRCSLPHPYHE